MSALAGIFYFDGRPVDPRLAASMGELLDAYGPDGGGAFVQPGLVMVHRALRVTPEDARERQPLRSARGHVITWDGRLDNRDDLLAQLWHDLRDDTTDVALALAAYERWGADGFARLVGDWSLVVWDAERQAIVMASDYMGVRPLHYYAQPDSVTWSTTLECAVQLHDLYHEIDQRYPFRLLTSMTSFARTPYKGLLAVPPARSLTFERSKAVTERRFWSFGAHRIHYDDPRDYEPHLRAVFLRSVKDRLRSAGPVWAQLSGGLDSSAVVCAADMLLKTGAANVSDFHTLSFVSTNSPDSDESRFMACVEEQCGRVAHRLIQDHKPGRTHPGGHWLSPTQPSYGALESYQLVRDHGARVLFTGEFGDSVMANFSAYHHDVAHLIRRGHPIQGVAMARRRALAERGRIWDLLFAAGMELLPPRVLLDYTMARDLREIGDVESRATATDRHIADTFLIKPEFAHWWREDAAVRYRRSLTFEDMSHRRLIREVMSAAESRLGQSPSEVPLIRVSHPYVDRRLVEFMAAISIDVAAPPGKPRHLMRQAFAPFMPARVTSRFSKGMPAGFWIRNTRDIVSRWLASPGDIHTLRLPFVDRERVLTYLRRLQVNEVRPRSFILLMRIEQWLQAREQRDRSALERHSPLSVA